jgi:hypothetical protein
MPRYFSRLSSGNWRNIESPSRSLGGVLHRLRGTANGFAELPPSAWGLKVQS